MLVSGFFSSVCEVLKVHFIQVVKYLMLYRDKYIHDPYRMVMQEDGHATGQELKVLTSYSCRTFFQTLTVFFIIRGNEVVTFLCCYFMCVHYLLATAELSPSDESVVFEGPFLYGLAGPKEEPQNGAHFCWSVNQLMVIHGPDLNSL